MNLLHSKLLSVATAMLGFTLQPSTVRAVDNEPAAISAKNLAADLSALRNGTSYVRLRLTVKQPANAKAALQLQIKERRSKTGADLVYQVLWPKERKGEGILLHKTEGGAPTGSLYVPPEKPRILSASQMNNPLFGSALSYEDVIDNFFGWENQVIVGTEVLDRVSCLILESKPGKGDSSSYAKVRSWVDPRRLVPLRIEKYLPSGQMARGIDTTRVVTDDKGRFIPADLTVRNAQEGSVTDLDGSRIRHDVIYTDREFSPEGLTEILAPPSAPE